MPNTFDPHGAQLWMRFEGWTFRDDVEPFIVRMQESGYKPASICRAVSAVGQYARWLVDQHGNGNDVTEQTDLRYLSSRSRTSKIPNGSRSALMRFVAGLREAGSIAYPPVVDPHHQIVKAFSNYLRDKRGFAPSTITSSAYYALPFLREIWDARSENLPQISRRDITNYVEQHAHDCSVRTTQSIFTRLRLFLRYLFSEALLGENLAPCIPTISNRKQAALPTFLTPAQLQSVLDVCDRTTPAGRRDYAILLLLARLGLRANEVSRLSLDDIDWNAGLISVHGKAGTHSTLPLPAEVGEAIADYLINDRRPSGPRQVFQRLCTPKISFPSSVGVIMVARRSLKRSGVTGVASLGSHVFRHTLATDMVRSGATLTEIGQILRHLNHDTTRIYAKVDLPRLRLLSVPWPEATQPRADCSGLTFHMSIGLDIWKVSKSSSPWRRWHRGPVSTSSACW